MQAWTQRAGRNGMHELVVMVYRVLSPGVSLSQSGAVVLGGEANTGQLLEEVWVHLLFRLSLSEL